MIGMKLEEIAKKDKMNLLNGAGLDRDTYFIKVGDNYEERTLPIVCKKCGYKTIIGAYFYVCNSDIKTRCKKCGKMGNTLDSVFRLVEA